MALQLDLPKAKMPQAEVTIEIPFHDVDMMNIAWHGHYVKYLEIARCQLLDAIDYNYREMQNSGYGWPVIEMHIRYAKPMAFQQKIKVIATLEEWETRMKIHYKILDVATGARLTKAHTVQVAVDLGNGEMQFACPEILVQRVKAYADKY